jgi:hypothetical protein
MNIIPKCEMVFMGRLHMHMGMGHGMRGCGRGLRIVPSFDDLDETVKRVNEKLAVDGLPGMANNI